MTEDDLAGRRATKRQRQCARKIGTAPSAVYYVGYVEDDETPASIARKFEELERIQAASRASAGAEAAPAQQGPHRSSGQQPSERPADTTAAAGDGTLTDEQLMEVGALLPHLPACAGR